MAVSPADPRLQHAGFARLVGEGVDYTVRKYSVVLGRPNKTLPVDVVLTSAMSVSRQHARIYYNFETRQFELEVLGKNGFIVDGVQHEANGPPVPLKSKALLQVGADVSFHFLLPKRKSKVLEMLRSGGLCGEAHPLGAATPGSGGGGGGGLDQAEHPLAAVNQMLSSSDQQAAMYAAAAAVHVQQQQQEQQQRQQLAMVAQALAWQQQQAAAAAQAQILAQAQAAEQRPDLLQGLLEQLQQVQQAQQAQQAQQQMQQAMAAMVGLSPQQQLQLLIHQHQQQQQQQGTPPGSLPPPPQ